ncbi:intermembrane lipid transfer protein VPS13D-like [Salvelinus alpinus]|uniref:intermembrane lipid transfer protein VPS13D-like n=1 Tax=Salvelinus alpinus TaxID=8036 RepID=UPI0039FC8198
MQDRYPEVKINVTGTEFVVVKDSSCLDTNAIILKGTTVLTYKPCLLDRPFSGSLAGIECFPVGSAASSRQPCPSLTQSTCRWSYVAVPPTRAALAF